jgi:replicative DNA helicase
MTNLQELKSYLPSYLDELGLPTKKAFNCISPDHDDRNPSMSYDAKTEKVHCFSCLVSFDLLDVIAIHEFSASLDSNQKPIYDFKQVSEWASSHFGVKPSQAKNKPNKASGEFIDYFDQSNQSKKSDINFKVDYSHSKQSKAKQVEQTTQQDKNDYTAYYELVRNDLDKASVWLSNRGIELDTAREYGLGYDSQKNTLIIPKNKRGYTSRQLDATGNKIRYMNHGTAKLFNPEALKSDDYVFIVEGSLDALSIIQSGYKALSTESISNKTALFEELDRLGEEYSPRLLLAYDNDQQGKQATKGLINTLQDSRYSYLDVSSELYGDCKDANELLAKDSEQLKESLTKAVTSLQEQLEKELQETSALAEVQPFIDEISKGQTQSAVSTGFKSLDNNLDGGFFSGLYILGAISSLGKTTLALQFADTIAKSGRDVLVISLEMSKYELMAKSLSRETRILKGENTAYKGATFYPMTTRTILTKEKFKNQSEDSQHLFGDAVAQYETYAKHLYIYEGLGDIGVDKIKSIVDKHYRIKGIAPVVIIDYLQILAPYNERYTDKQNTDRNVMELKRLSRDYQTTVLGISSFNRESYNNTVSMSSFKESGAIEYSSDVLLGLEFANMKQSDGKQQTTVDNMNAISQGKQATERNVRLKILKNRNGRANVTNNFIFYSMFNYFEEDADTSKGYDFSDFKAEPTQQKDKNSLLDRVKNLGITANENPEKEQ